MRPDYKNWMPKGMVVSAMVATAVSLVTSIALFVTVPAGALKSALLIVCIVATIMGCAASVWMFLMYRAFSYEGKRRMSRQIIEGVAGYVKLPEGGIGLDVGCGSGALTIACAKRNPKASIVGIDRWGKEYVSYNKPLCERNARAEGVDNVRFEQGDATHLGFSDESFDAVVSNYVYHNIAADRQALLSESLRVLKKGGTFAIHDIFSKSKYGDMQAFVKGLYDRGYADVRLIDTTDGTLIEKGESVWMGLAGSALLVGIK